MKYRSIRSKLLAMLLVMAMVVGFFPAKAQAAEGSLSLGEGKVVMLNPGETVDYTFIPEESGEYVIYRENWDSEIFTYVVDVQSLDSWEARVDDTYYHGERFFLDAGVEYQIRFGASDEITWQSMDEFFIGKLDEVTSMSLPEAAELWTNEGAVLNLTLNSLTAFDSDIELTSSNEEVVSVGFDQTWGCNAISIYGQSAGTAVITATLGDISTSCTVTVKESIALELDIPVEITKEEAGFKFTAPEAGLYWAKWEHCDVDFSFHFYSYMFGDRTHHGAVYQMTEGETYYMTLRIPEEYNKDATPFVITAVTEATDIAFPEGDSLTGLADHRVSYPYELVGGEVVQGFWAEVADESIVYVDRLGDGELEVYFRQPGETTITIRSANGIEKKLNVVCLEYGHDAVASWSGTAQADTVERLEYTPDHDGFYFLNSDQGTYGFDRSQEGEQPLAVFDWDENGYWGNVYQLEAGKTYYWDSNHDWEYEYHLFLHEVEVATDVSIPETLTGKVNESIWMEIELDGAVSTELTSSNPDVAIVGGGDARGNTIWLVDEGTAVITCTDVWGNVDTCTITVEGEETDLHFDWQTEFAIGAGRSITYAFTPGEFGSGYYWFRVLGGEEGLATVKLTDAEGNALDTYECNRGGDIGVVGKLGGEEYLVTVSSQTTGIFTLDALYVKEANGIAMDITSFSGEQGDRIGTSFWLTGDDSGEDIVGNITVTSSDPEVVKVISYTMNHFEAELVGGGTADIIISLPNGISQTFTVVSEGIDSVYTGEPFDVTLAEGGVERYEFIPEESGNYVFVSDIENDVNFYTRIQSQEYDEDLSWSRWSSYEEGVSGLTAYGLNAGTKYYFCVEHPGWGGEDTNTFTIYKTQKPTYLQITHERENLYVGDCEYFRVEFDSYLIADRIEWSVEGDGNFEIWGSSATELELKFNEAGTYTIHAQSGELTQSTTVTVKEPISIELDKVYQVGEPAQRYIFTAEEAGVYFFSVDEKRDIYIDGTWGGYDEYWFTVDGRAGLVVKLNEGETFSAGVRAHEYEDGYGTGNVLLHKVTEATDVIINNGQPIVGYCNEWKQIPFTLVGGEVANLQFRMADYEIADVYWNSYDASFFTFEGYMPGTTTLTVTGPNGINKTIQATCVAYNYDAVAHWSGTADSEVIVLEYTPATTGLYFLNADYEHPCDAWNEEGAQPLYWFGYEANNYHGMAYKLEAGKTYCFTTYVGYGQEYDIYLKPVKESTTIKAESTFSGKVNEVGWLPIELDGVGGLDAYSSNEEVVIPGGWNTGGMSLLCVGEGTAVVTILDQHGNEVKCTVTVKDEVEMGMLFGGMEAALGSGKSITYFREAWMSGPTWFFSEMNSGWEITVTDKNGKVLSGYEYSEYDVHGKVYDLEEGQMYYITYTNPGAPMWTFVGMRWGQEAIDVDLGDGYFAGFEGEEGWIWYNVVGEEEEMYTFANLTVTSSDPTVAKVVENTGHEIVLDLLKEGTATITVTLPNGQSDSQTITVWKTNQLALNQQYTNVLKVYEDHYDVVKYVFTPAESGTYTLKASTDGHVIFDTWDTAEFSEVFEINAATKTFEMELTAGKECVIYIANWAETPGTATVTWSLEGEVKDGWNLEDGKWTYVENGNLTVGWKQIGGSFYYFDESGFMKTGWIEDGGKWYYTNGSGQMITGWKQLGKTWYYFNANGSMATGWLLLGSTWYYMNPSGGMVTGTYVIDGAVNEFNSSGAWLGTASGWKQMNGSWYYLTNGGKVTTGWKLLGATWYYFDAEGIMQTGWQTIDGADYFFHAGGGMATGWVQDGSIWYYMNSSGRKVTGDVMIGGALNRFDEEGVWLGYAPAGWRQDGNNWYYLGSGGKITTGWKLLGKTWYYFNANGVMQTGWLQLGSTWYYLNTSGGMVTGTYVIDGAMNEFNSSGVWLGYSKAGWKQVNNQWYYLGNGGKVMTGWQLIGSKTWYYFNAEGVMQTGWLQLGNTKYYLTESGAMVTGTYVIDDVTYEFNSSGALITK